MKEDIKKLRVLCPIFYEYGWYKERSIWKKGIETIVDSDNMMQLNYVVKKCRRTIRL